MVVSLPVGMKCLVERYKFFEERITLGVRASRVFKRERAEAQMQLAHTLEKRKVLNVLRLDFVRQRIVVGTFALLGMLVGGGGERNVFGHDSFHLRGHFLDLRMGQGLYAEVVILLKLIVHHIVAAVNLRDYVSIHNLIAGQLQKVKSADGVVALAFGRFKPLAYLFSKFVVHKSENCWVSTKVPTYSWQIKDGKCVTLQNENKSG